MCIPRWPLHAVEVGYPAMHDGAERGSSTDYTPGNFPCSALVMHAAACPAWHEDRDVEAASIAGTATRPGVSLGPTRHRMSGWTVPDASAWHTCQARSALKRRWVVVQWPRCGFETGNDTHSLLGIMSGRFTDRFGEATFSNLLLVRPLPPPTAPLPHLRPPAL